MDQVKLMWSKTNRWHRALLIFLIIEMRWIPGGLVGFTCNDLALSYKFNGDTITAKHLFGTIFLLPLAVLLLVERAYHPDRTGKPKLALRWYKEYVFGMLINLILVEFLKVIVGAPRPHFFDTCGPKEAATCEDSEYVNPYTCTKAYWLTQSNTSFPSGHTALAVHAGLFIIYYLHKRAKRNHAVLVIQIVAALVAVLCGVSRMWDHRHHWWDVVAGGAIGIPILLYTIVYLCNNFEAPSENREELKPRVMETNSNGVVIEAKDT